MWRFGMLAPCWYSNAPSLDNRNRIAPESITKNILSMSVTNIIDDERVTIVQGVNGILLCQESWMADKSDRWDRNHPSATNATEPDGPSSI